jgi:hypothetical protein
MGAVTPHRPGHRGWAPQGLAGQPFDHVTGLHLGLSQVERWDRPARRRSLPTQASAAITTRRGAAECGRWSGRWPREQGSLGAPRVGNDRRPVKPPCAGRGQPLSAGQYRQLHLRGRAIVDSSGGSGVGAPVSLSEWGCARPSEPPLQRRTRHPERDCHLPGGWARADCSDHGSPTVVKRFFSSCHLLPYRRNTRADRELLTHTLTEMG